MGFKQECPKCGKVFYTKNNATRIRCRSCNTSWDTDNAGCAFIFILIFVSPMIFFFLFK